MLKLVHDNDSKAVPVPHIQEVLDFLQYASVERVMFQMLYYTGCRVSELDRMSPATIYENTIYWQLGKNQKRWRKEHLPPAYLRELNHYRNTNRCIGDQLFGISSATLRRYFNRDVRPHLSDDWRAKRLRPRVNALEPEFILQLKGLRKTFQTMLFAKEWQRWGSAEVAVEFTSKRMEHSSKHITCKHYIENFDSLRIREISVYDPASLVRSGAQLRIMDY